MVRAGQLGGRPRHAGRRTGHRAGAILPGRATGGPQDVLVRRRHAAGDQEPARWAVGRDRATYMNIFIDTNIWLSFYHFSSDDLEELRKLGVLLEKRTVRVHLPEQVVEEFRRNREAKFVDAMKRFKDEKLSDEFPQLC